MSDTFTGNDPTLYDCIYRLAQQLLAERKEVYGADSPNVIRRRVAEEIERLCREMYLYTGVDIADAIRAKYLQDEPGPETI